jgi:hypothetical protein
MPPECAALKVVARGVERIILANCVETGLQANARIYTAVKHEQRAAFDQGRRGP